MTAAFFICVGYALLGLVFSPHAEALVAFSFVAVWSFPLLIAGSWDRETIEHPKPSFLFFWSIVGLGVLNLALFVDEMGKSLSDLTNFEALVSFASDATVRRYEEKGSTGSPLILAMSLFLVYRLGAADDSTPLRWKLIGVAPILVLSLISGAKFGMMLASVMFLAGLFIAYHPRKAMKKASVYGAAIIGGGGFLAGLAMVLRGFEETAEQIAFVLAHYLFAQYHALGHWILENKYDCCSLGSYTFIGPLGVLGLVQREPGVWSDSVDVYGINTNIFTAWRYIVEDLTVAGPLVMNMLLATLFVWLAQRRESQGAVALATGIKAFCIMSALMSLAVPLFTFNSVILAAALSIGYSMRLAERAHPFKLAGAT